MAWRAADSLSAQLLASELHDPAPDHSTISRTRRLIDLEMHTAVFTWTQRLADGGLVTGQTIGIDATTLEASGLAEYRAPRHGGHVSGVLDEARPGLGDCDTDRADLARVARDARRARTTTGRSARSRRENHQGKMAGRTWPTKPSAVDLDTGAIVGVTVQPANAGDTTTLVETLITAAEQIETVQPAADTVRELVGDKGYHAIRSWWTWRRSACAPTFRNPIAGGGPGAARPRPATRSIGTADASAGPGANDSCANAVNGWNAPLRICTRRARCGVFICGGTPTS